MAINPDIIFISPFKRGGYDAIRDVDIPMLPHLGYKELTPLGQAEWIKVVGLLTGNPAEANSIFQSIEQRYNELKSMVDTVSARPTVFSGEMRGGNWYAVGGNSFLAQLFRDAGGDYFLKDNKESGGVTLDYETVYTNAAHADYWRIVNSYDGDYSYDVLKEQDKRYMDFDAWRKHGVIYCNMKEVPFYEKMPVEPEVVLSDFIHVFHPDILPDHEPRYYHLLK
ncbi:MAG: ABC transporter substrate-binding protein, partial [Muribaculaceae bacterium]|nr:ABC transporter substrate-binding protein [Muribaculaceae bacterium]